MEILNNFSLLKETQDETILKDKMEAMKKDGQDEKLKEACKEFESIFVHMMMKKMKDSIPEGGLTEKSTGRDVFEDMYLEELSKEVVKKDDGLGIAKMMYEQFKNEYTIK